MAKSSASAKKTPAAPKPAKTAAKAAPNGAAKHKAAAKVAPQNGGGKNSGQPGPRKPAKPEPVPAKPAAKVKPELTAKITHLIAEEMAIEEAELTPNASFKEDLNLDEIDVAELLMQCEVTFGVHTFSEEDWEGCETVGDFTALVEKRIIAKRAKK